VEREGEIERRRASDDDQTSAMAVRAARIEPN